MGKSLGTRKSDMLFPSMQFVADALALYGAALATYSLRFASGWFPTPLGVPPLSVYLLADLVMMVTTLSVFYRRGHYRPRPRGSLVHEVPELAFALGVSLALQLSFLFFWRGFSFSRTYVLSLAALALLCLIGARRLVSRAQVLLRARGLGLSPVALLGRSPMTEEVWRRLRENPGFGLEAVGIIEEEGAVPASSGAAKLRAFAAGSGAAAGTSAAPASTLPVLGTSDELEALAEAHGLDAVVVTLPFERYGHFVELAERLSSINVKCYLVPDLVGLSTSRLHHFELVGIPFLAIRHVPLAGLGRVLKRSFDLVAAGLALILLSPLMGLIALSVLVEDGRPVFYRQIRLGRDGRRFAISKFRTMRRDAESLGAARATAKDARRTRLGAFLRATSLDELPQLGNVLRGDMSLVGPRPERPEFVADFSRSIPRYFERHRVRSGITGWAQVNGLRGDTPIEERTRFDLFYVENWSLAFDLKILWLTLRAVLSRKHAY